MYTYRELLDPKGSGVAHLPGFMSTTDRKSVLSELADQGRVTWQDSHHATYTNQRGLTIVQNHDTFALKLSRGDQRPLARLPYFRAAIGAIKRHVREMSVAITPLRAWVPDEASVHRYDNAEIGLSFHKDNARFVGLIAILSLDGVCDLAVQRPQGIVCHTANPGDLVLLRAPGLIHSTEDLRPEHAVVNLRTPTRTSLMVRANDRPDDIIPGFTFANWTGDTKA